MYRVKVSIQGVAPILFNRFSEEAQDALDKGKTGGVFSKARKERELEAKLYKNGEGQLYIPPHALKECLLQGATKGSLKYGKKGLAPFLKALIFVEEQALLLGKTMPDFIDERIGRRPPRTGGACVIRRPGVNAGWAVSFTLVVGDERIPEEHIKSALEEAGLLVGLLDGRPEFGRFVVTQWEKIIPKKEVKK